ncbi:unnamed protein product [Oikopleura dioica]|uniref:Uncharacterized protein n=1 Tax=Oikopleura dioica TaxID=34765 RepID=E4XD15_OIKDI|nr:unnamed protein product [Oikopleura dioica]
MSSRQLSKRPRSSVQSTPRRLNRPRSTPSRFSLVCERPCRASESFKNIITLLLRVGITEKQSSDEIPPLLFFPVLAKDEEITREMLLSGAETSDCFLQDGILLEAITLSPETTADITAMLVYSRAVASRPAQISSSKRINKKVELFLSQKISRECSSALFRCAKGGHLAQCVSLILSGSDINEEFAGNTVLGVAILNGHFELVAELIRLGANCSSAQSSGGNPVGLVLHPATDHLFTITQKIELVNLLVDSGAKIYSKCKLRQKSTSLINTVDFIDKAFHPKYGKPPLRGGFFSELSQDEKRNYLARGEFQSYLLSILKEQLTELAHAKDPKALSACFECGTANKKLVPDSHFKVIAFCGSKCRKLFWRSNPSRTKIISRKRRVFNFEPFFLQSNLIDNYSYN